MDVQERHVTNRKCQYSGVQGQFDRSTAGDDCRSRWGSFPKYERFLLASTRVCHPLPAFIGEAGSYAPNGSVRPVRLSRQSHFLEGVRALDRAFRTVLHPPSAKTEVSLGDVERRKCRPYQPRTGSVGRIRRHGNVLKFVAPDFLSDMPKVRNADDGSDDAVGA
ncbi:hypothetical protein J6590_040485 [Homalodisca vitripennis]|nr:hypothetical protein J6590_040485 [Homalodisca vitripennis]